MSIQEQDDDLTLECEHAPFSALECMDGSWQLCTSMLAPISATMPTREAAIEVLSQLDAAFVSLSERGLVSWP